MKKQIAKLRGEKPVRERSTRNTEEMQSMLKTTLWFHEKQVMPLLSPFWAWRPTSQA